MSPIILFASFRDFRYFIKANENDQDEEDYLVDHSTVLYLVGPNGDFLDFFTSSVSAPEIASRIGAHIDPSKGPSNEIGPKEVWQSTLTSIGKLIRDT